MSAILSTIESNPLTTSDPVTEESQEGVILDLNEIDLFQLLPILTMDIERVYGEENSLIVPMVISVMDELI